MSLQIHLLTKKTGVASNLFLKYFVAALKEILIHITWQRTYFHKMPQDQKVEITPYVVILDWLYASG